MKKKLLSLPILVMFVLSVLNASMIDVSAVDFPDIMVVPDLVENVVPGENFTVSIYTNYPGYDVTAYQFTLSYNPGVLNGVEVANGDLIVGHPIYQDPRFVPGDFDNTNGELSMTVGYFYVEGAVTNGPGILANVTFNVVDSGASNIVLGPETKLIGWDDWLEPPDYVIPTDILDGYFINIPPEQVTHDIAVTSVTPSSTSVLVGSLVDVTVAVENQGKINEQFDVTVYANDTVIGTKTVGNLGSGLTTSLNFTWDTTGADVGNYTAKATASTVPEETDTEDNTLESVQKINVRPPIYLPVAIITYEETVAYANVTMYFGGGESYDPDGGVIVSFDWDFGDGETATGQDVLHSYETIGFYNLSLTVTDSSDQVSDPPATLTITIEEYPPEPPAYFADLVKWKVKPEAHSWDYSKDDDKNVTLTALASNFGTNAVNVTITFDIIDWKKGISAGDPILADATLAVGETVPVDVLLDPYDYTYIGEKLVLQVDVTLKYDSDGDGTPDTDASSKIIHFSIVP